MAFLPRVKKSWCGCSLRTGTLVIAWVQTLCAIANIIIKLMDVTEYADATNMILYIFQLIFGVVLLYGTKKRLSVYLKAYVIFGVLSMCIALAIVVPSIIHLMMEFLLIGGIILAILFPFFAFYSYALVIVYSYYKEILEDIKDDIKEDTKEDIKDHNKED